jgi:tRNA (guanine26-N2/guanine27-N2)-dimethyltransferase
VEQVISEGSSKVYGELKKVVSAEMEVFYNPIMQINRDSTILVLAAENKKDMKIADPLAGSGMRALRLIKELDDDCISKIIINDKKYKFEEYFTRNIVLNKLSKTQKEKLFVESEDANLSLLSNKSYDYIDIDPFGTPNPFLDAAVQTIKNKGILAVTATDTSALCGSYPTACKRKYWAVPLRDEWMHEFGMRILIRKVQLIGAQFDVALTPIFSYAKDHYMKIFFRCSKGKSRVDEILSRHISIAKNEKEYGPIWSGQLWESALVDKMLKISRKENMSANIHQDTKKLLGTISEESKIEKMFFMDVHELARDKKTGNTPQFEKLMTLLREKGFHASRTHFSLTGIRTDSDDKTFIKAFDDALK